MTIGIYFVTPPGAPDQLIMAAVRGGVSMVQLRDKRASDSALIARARRLAPPLAAAGVQLIVNDRLAVALAVPGIGLHIGQSDGCPRAARGRLGRKAHLGLSIENADQLAAIPPSTVDLIGVGPVRTTASKPDHAPPIGFDDLARITAASPVPAVAIGGIGAGDMARIRAAGCTGAAVMSAIAGARDPEAAARNLVQEWRQS
ncbi:MAG: thiamine phosphate synthase [Paracoccus sp. (in: a-proteobacteria)]